MTDVLGVWELAMRTPIGALAATMRFIISGASLIGTARSSHEEVPLLDIRVTVMPEADRVTWSQTITKPMRLNLIFDVFVTGDYMEGHARAGRLPQTQVTGIRARIE